jgi:methionyl-tRNA synthetase
MFCSIKDSSKLHNNQTDRNTSVIGQDNITFHTKLYTCYVHTTKSLAHLAYCSKITLGICDNVL